MYPLFSLHSIHEVIYSDIHISLLACANYTQWVKGGSFLTYLCILIISELFHPVLSLLNYQQFPPLLN